GGGGAEAVAEPVLYVHLVLLGEDCYGGPAVGVVRLDEVGDDRGDLVRPGQDHRVVSFDHDRALLAQLLDLHGEAADQHTDQSADDEDAAQGEDEPEHQLYAPGLDRDAEAERGDEGFPQVDQEAAAGGAFTFGY